jgi:hypothetical protein
LTAGLQILWLEQTTLKLAYEFAARAPIATSLTVTEASRQRLALRILQAAKIFRCEIQNGARLIQVHNLLSEILKTESFSMEVDSNLNTTVTMTTMSTLMCPLLQDPQARCNVPLLHVYVQVYSLV